METYIGYIKSPQDALLIFEACRQGQLNRVQRRLSSKERMMNIQSGSIFAFDEGEAGMRRWTDGKTWSPSRVLGSFLTYRELDTKRRPRRPQTTASSSSPSTSPSPSSSDQHHPYHHNNSNVNKMTGHAMCSYKQDGLIKQSFSICTAENQKLHLISYYSKKDVLNGRLQQPTMDPALNKISIPKGLYPIMNPLDTSDGHSSTLHNLRRQQGYQEDDHHHEEEEQDDSMDHHHHGHSSAASSYSSPPSLSSSPFTSDEDINMDLSSSSPTYSPFPPPPAISSQQHSYHPSSLLLPTQEIAWEKMPSSEDQRQLQAIQGLLRL